nr:MAG TPA: hypothetical protein [Bacteriophage sp.]
MIRIINFSRQKLLTFIFQDILLLICRVIST